MRLQDPEDKGRGSPTEGRVKFAREISAIIEKHEKKLLSSIYKPPREVLHEQAYEQMSEEYAENYAKCERELRLTRLHLLDSRPFDQDDSEELKEMIANKLAVTSMDRVHPSDWWWTPADSSSRGILREVEQTLERETTSKAGASGRILYYARLILPELAYLGIVAGLFSIASSRFEIGVFAALVMIYNSVAYTGSAIYRGLYSLMWRAERTRGELGRALRLKVPASPGREAEKALRDSRVAFMIHMGSITIASLIALWHLVIAIVR